MKKLSLLLTLCALVCCIVSFAAEPPNTTPPKSALASHVGYKCDTVNGEIVRWYDERPQPTEAEWQAIAADFKTAREVKKAASRDEMVDALWALMMEGDRTKADAIKAKRDAAKAKAK